MERGTPILVFFLVGLSLWALGGWINGMICFQPTVPLELIKNNKELATEITSAWLMLQLKLTAIWALAGGILGVVISQLFIARPEYEHFSRTPKLPGIPEMPGFSGPKTMAEINAGFQGWILGVIIGVCATVFILPLLQSEFFVVRQSFTRIIFCVIQTLIVTVPILPFSLGILSKMIKRRY